MIEVYGKTVDTETRCVHYHSSKDIIAIKFACCHTYYPCYKCHEECADHPIEIWKREQFHEKAILCGVCGTEHTIAYYLQHHHCNHCQSIFNEGCANHYHLYFDV